MKMTRRVSNYSFNIPPKLTEIQFYQSQHTLPVYPKPKNILVEVVIEHWLPLLTMLFPPFWIFNLFNGTYESIMNLVFTVRRQNRYLKSYYEILYNAKTYDEYCEKLDALQKMPVKWYEL